MDTIMERNTIAEICNLLGKSWNSIQIVVEENAQKEGTEAPLNAIVCCVCSNRLAI